MAPPVTKALDPLDAALDASITKFYMLKVSGAGNIGTNNDPAQPFNNYFSTQDIGVIQSTAFLQDINSLEFRAGTPTPNAPWVDFLTPTNPSDTTNSADFGGIVITWDVDHSNPKVTAQNFCDKTIASINTNAGNEWFVPGQGFPGLFARIELVNAIGKASFEFLGKIAPNEILDNLNDIKNHSSCYTENESFDTRFPLDPLVANNLRDIISEIYGSDPDKIDNVIRRNVNSFYNIDATFQTLEASLFGMVGDRYLTPVFENFINQTPYPNVTSGVHGNFNVLSGLNLTGLYDQVTGGTAAQGSLVSVGQNGLLFSSAPPSSFTGLTDTPPTITASGFVRGDKNGNELEFSDINLVSGDIKDIPIPQGLPNGSGYLHADWSLGQPVLSWSPSTAGNSTINVSGSEFFTGLKDTPSSYQDGSFLSSSPAGIVYSNINDKLVSFTGLSDTPDAFSQDKFLKSTAGALEFTDAPPYQFTGLTDTPVSYTNSNGQYLRVKNNSIEFVDISGEIDSSNLDWTIYQRIGDLPSASDNAGMFTYVWDGIPSGAYVSDGNTWHKIFPIDPSAIVSFTGLTDTPNSYSNASGKYLRVKDNEDGVEFFNIPDSAPKPPKFNNTGDLPDPIDNDREIVIVGCDLYVSCDGKWKPVSTESDSTDSDSPEGESLPGCVSTLGESIQYQTYKDTIVSQNLGFAFDQGLSNQIQNKFLNSVCLLTTPSNNQNVSVKIAESSYKWGLFTDNTTINIEASVDNHTDNFIHFQSNSNTPSDVQDFYGTTISQNVGVVNSTDNPPLRNGYGISNLKFDGSSALKLDNNDKFNLNSDFTIDFWYYRDSFLGTDINTVFSIEKSDTRTPAGNDSMECYVQNNGNMLFQFDTTTNSHPNVSFSSSLQTWTYLKVVRVSDRVMLYVDGEQKDSIDLNGAILNFDSSFYMSIGGRGGILLSDMYLQDFRLRKGVVDMSTSVPTTLLSAPEFYNFDKWEPASAVANPTSASTTALINSDTSITGVFIN